MRLRLGPSLVSISVVGFWLAASLAAATPLFVGLGHLPGPQYESYALDVSADGAVVVGQSDSSNAAPTSFEAFRWTQAGGMVSLIDPNGSDLGDGAFGVSAHGSVIVGRACGEACEAFYWTQAGGMVGLGDPPGGAIGSAGWDVSADGSVVVGDGHSDSGQEAFRWTQAGGMVGLGDLPGGQFSSYAYGVSGDGLVVVGESRAFNSDEAFRWTQTDGMVGLGHLPGFEERSHAWDVSADGLVVVGGSSTSTETHAFRWTQAEGMVAIGDLPGSATFSDALGVSPDGSVIVGESEGHAFIWDARNGMRKLQDVLVAMGLDLTGWRLEAAQAISDDGLTIVGYGSNPDGRTEAWLAQIPEPSSLFLLVLSAASLAVLRSLRA